MAAVAIIEASTAKVGEGDSDVAQAAAGDRGAFERLYRQHVNRVFSLCARMVADRTRAEELTQDVFVRAWEKLHLFRGESSFSTWLHRLTVNVVLNARKSEGRQRSRFEASLECRSPRAICSTSRPRWQSSLRERDGCSFCTTWKATSMRRSPRCSA
jgi:DNA-directed RNA polymerase specialized sigma24 family protein